MQNAIMENFQTEPLPSWPLLKLNHPKLPVKLRHGRNGAGKRSLLTRKKIDVPRRKSLGLRIKGGTSARKLGEYQILAANEELESYAETELQEFSQHMAIQELEVEVNGSRE